MWSKIFITAIVSLFLAVSCKSSRNTSKESAVTINYAAQKYEKGTVKFWELDGCTYLIELENGNKLNPGMLDSAYASDNLKVWVKYKQVDRMNICMSGTTVDIIDIQIRKE